ncbi:MAG: IS66 family insertion sequence element accessory protein TnpB [Anaeromyxobacter sp.]
MIPAGVRIFRGDGAGRNMRRGFVGLAEAARDGLGHDPAGGALFVFFNKRRDKLKLLWHDRTGWRLLYMGLDRGFFRIPDAAPGQKAITIDGRELAAILEGVQLPASKTKPRDIAAKARDAALRTARTDSNQAGR